MIELFVDIETIPTAEEALIREISESIQPPKTMSKAETIAKWEAEDKPRLIDEAVAKTSLDGTYGRVCCISYAFGDAPVEGIIDRDEKKVLSQFFKVCTAGAVDPNTKTPVGAIVIGHNVASFDLRFLWQRAIINKIQPPKCLPWDGKPWGDRIADTMYLWNPDKDKRISLHKLCLALGIPSPKESGITGADIARFWAQRKYEEILTYAQADVTATRECYRRMSI